MINRAGDECLRDEREEIKLAMATDEELLLARDGVARQKSEKNF